MAKKQRTSFVCQECGYDSPQWLGKCPECGNWNSLKEIKLGVDTGSFSSVGQSQTVLTPRNLGEITLSNKNRLQTEFAEFNGVLGGGIVQGSVILLAGDPGVGKSTLLLQLCLGLSFKKNTVLYASGEESEEQIKLRASRIIEDKKYSGKNTDNSTFQLVSATNTDAIITLISETKPSIVIIDSIQTMESQNVGGLSGSVAQVRYAATQFIRAAKTLNIPIILVGHVTKEGMVAGPMVLTHMVDVVLFLEGEKVSRNRILRSFKNRFGPVDEVGIFLMGENGIEEIINPEQLFLSKEGDQVPGSVLAVTLEGTRAFLVEIQALVVATKFPMPRRVASGVDSRRLELLLAVLQKHCNVGLFTYDIFVSVAGGMKISDPGADLAICLAIYASLKNIRLSQTVAVSEVGLLGELRTVSMLDKREKEAKKLGYKTIYTAKNQKTLLQVIQTVGKTS